MATSNLLSTSDALLWLCAEEGIVDPFAHPSLMDSVQPGVCMDSLCGAVSDSCEPDAYSNWCHACGSNTVKSISVLLGVL